MTNPNPHLNVTKLYEEFNQAIIRLGFMPSESEGYKVVQLTFSSPARNDKIMYRIPFVSDGSERITLLVHQAGFTGDWAGCDGIPEQIREEAHRKLCELVGVPYEPMGADRQQQRTDKEDCSQPDTVNGNEYGTGAGRDDSRSDPKLTPRGRRLFLERKCAMLRDTAEVQKDKRYVHTDL
ncbi:MAG: hypothetical protein K0R28_7206 [Paenibacillus sp.]|nr:hypothetical protein [Paenibacillus sp.]